MIKGKLREVERAIIMRVLFAAENMRSVFVASRQRTYQNLLDAIRLSSDGMLSVLGPSGKTIDWLCATEERVWWGQIGREKSLAALWITIGVLCGLLIALLGSFTPPSLELGSAMTSDIGSVILCFGFLASCFVVARSMSRLSVLKHSGYAARSEHIFEHLGGNFWITGNRGVYLVETTASDDRFFESAVRYDYERLEKPKLTVGPDVITISLYENEGRFISNMIFSAEDRFEADRVFATLESAFNSVRLSGAIPSIA